MGQERPTGQARERDRRLRVVVVSYRCERYLRECLASMFRHPPAVPMRVDVVDNASADGTAEMVRREFPQVSLTENDTNRGFSAANNQILRSCEEPFVLVLNPDIQLAPGVLDGLLAVMEANPRVGIAGPSLLMEDGRPDGAAKRSFPTPISALGYFSGIGRRANPHSEVAAYGAPDVERGPVDAVNGAFMLLRREALKQVGLFDEGYWMYMEDLDLCWRFKQAGWQTWYEPSVTAIHAKGGSAGPYRSLRLNYAFHYGMFRFYRSHYARDHNPLLNAAVYAGIAGKLAASVVRHTFHLGGPPHRISRPDAVVPGAETASEPPVPAPARSDDRPQGIGAGVRLTQGAGPTPRRRR